jgi:hypothetical protein
VYRIKRNYYDELTGEYLCTLTLRNIHHESIQKFFFNREKNLILEAVRGRLFFNHVHFAIFPATTSILNKFSSQSIAAHVSEFEKFISSDNWIPLRIEFSTSEVENTLE